MDKTEYHDPGKGVLLEGRPELFIPEGDLQKIDATDADLAPERAGKVECQHQGCGEWFTPRTKSGGKPQKFCSEKCRREADAERKANATNAPQCETPQAASGPASVARHTEFALAAPDDLEDDCWFIDNAEHIVVPQQDAVALYWNERGDLVIRQEKSWCDDRDHIICIHRGNLFEFIDKLSDMAGILSFPPK
jgi:hypothetical protein